MNHISSLKNILQSDNPEESINLNIEYLVSIIPELKYTIGFNQCHPHHHLNVFDHTVLSIKNSPNIFDVRLSLLLHDIGKPFSYQTGDDGVRNFKGHAKKSAKISRIILNRLGFEKSYVEKIVYLILNHDLPININNLNKNNIELETIRLMIQYADAKAHSPDKIAKRICLLDDISWKIKNKNLS